MVRRCAVPSCSSTDLTTLVHRFPRKHCTAWQKSLQLKSYSIKDLLEKYVVCHHHFRMSDYRHKESKHLNTTAIPTLDTIPETEKIPKAQTSSPKVNKRIITISTTNVDPDGGALNLDSNAVPGPAQIYSNCVTLTHSLPFRMTDLEDVHESDNSIENNFHSDGDIIEEETYMEDEEMMLESNISEDCSLSPTKELSKYETVTEYLRDDVDDTFTDNTSFTGETDLNCDSNAKTMLDDRLTNYVELIETIDQTDDEETDELLQTLSQQSDPNEDPAIEMYKNVSRDELIEQLVAATDRIKELETKLENIQKAHLSMIQNLNNFNKVLIS